MNTNTNARKQTDVSVQTNVKKQANVRRMVIIGILSGISIMLSMTPLGYIPIGPINATIMHIPVIIGAIIEGPIVGMAVGLMFGLTSMMKALTMPTVVSFVMMNPLISVLPRIAMGIGAYYIYLVLDKAISKKQISLILSGVLSSLLNTIGVLGMIYILYAKQYVEAIGKIGSPEKIIGAIALTNGLPEALLAGVVVSSVVMILKKIKK